MSTIPWWKRTTVYQVYPRSFHDSNGDGIGDLPGVLERLDYLQRLGVETLWLSPFFDSPQADFGYDVSDHYGVAEEYGTLEDAHRLIDAVHARGMKIVFDMVLNHTSDRHPWFLESKSGRDSPKRDYYLWRDGRGPGGRRPPNNWRSMLGGSGWHRDPTSGQWYWATFLPFQPDLNYRNPEVKEAMLDVVRHWLGRGVDGLRLDIFNAIYKDPSFANNPLSARLFPSEDRTDSFFQRHVHTIDHEDTLAFAQELRAVVDEFQDPVRFVVGEVFGSPADLRAYCDAEREGLHLVFLFKTLSTPFRADAVRALVDEMELHFAEPLIPTYVLGNHDRPRFIHRLGEDTTKAKLLATFQLTARGVPFIYYGEEIGMRDHELPLVHGLDPVARRFRLVPQCLATKLKRHGILLNRDEARTPMQWSAEPHGGFTTAKARPWLPLHPSAGRVNVAAQEDDPGSLLSHYRALLHLRRGSRALSAGRVEWLEPTTIPEDVVAYRRVDTQNDAEDVALVYLSFSRRERRVRLPPGGRRVLLSTRVAELTPAPPEVTLEPYEGVVVTDA